MLKIKKEKLTKNLNRFNTFLKSIDNIEKKLKSSILDKNSENMKFAKHLKSEDHSPQLSLEEKLKIDNENKNRFEIKHNFSKKKSLFTIEDHFDKLLKDIKLTDFPLSSEHKETKDHKETNNNTAINKFDRDLHANKNKLRLDNILNNHIKNKKPFEKMAHKKHLDNLQEVLADLKLKDNIQDQYEDKIKIKFHRSHSNKLYQIVKDKIIINKKLLTEHEQKLIIE